MQLKDFNYHLPPELIATHPTAKRDQSRLLVLDKATGAIEHKHFFDLIDYLKTGDLLVANNSKVIPARLLGKKSTGGVVEVFLSKNLGKNWECLIKGRVKAGVKIILSKKLNAEIVEVVGEGISLVKFNLTSAEFMKEVEVIGHTPLPPYIIKKRSQAELTSDKKNYQTVYAENLKKGSVAVPTAGLHFTPGLIKKIKAKGVGVEYLTLHVGLGTFLPVKTEKIEEYKIHSEYAEVSAELIKKIIETKKRGGRIIAVGTTTTRTLEFVFKNLDIKNCLKIKN
jgi:S-adenosylmethionine:tRNA ribosyltransferase-isomerase